MYSVQSSLSPTKNILKYKSTFSCNHCSKFNIKCDGELPCSRCKHRGYNCSYLQDPSIVASSMNTHNMYKEEKLFTISTTRRYIQLYFDTLNMVGLHYKMNTYNLEHPTSKSHHLQYNSILALVTRVFCTDSKAYIPFENKAKQICGNYLMILLLIQLLDFNFLLVIFG